MSQYIRTVAGRKCTRPRAGKIEGTSRFAMTLADSLLKKVPQYTRNSRHLRSLVQHGNPRKWLNFVRIETERKLRKTVVSSHPYLLIVDPCNYCNLRCPLCPTGVRALGRPQSMMSLDDFKNYFDPFAPYLLEVSLHNWGESLLNKSIFDMIEHAQRSNVGTNLSTNLVTATPEQIDRILDSGLEYLIVSLDGVSQDIYEHYRVGGNCEQVIENLRLLVERRRLKNKKTPVIEWQFIAMKHNEHQIPEAERISKRIGVDVLRFLPVGIPFSFSDRKEKMEEWLPSTLRKPDGHVDRQAVQSETKGVGPCFYLYRVMVVNPDGGVSPCCIVHQKKDDFGKLDGSQSIMDVWNNESFRAARSLYRAGPASSNVRTVCDACTLFSRK